MKCKEECYLQSDWHLCKCAETCKTVWFLSLLSPTSSLYHGVYVFPQRVFSSSCFFLLHTADNSDICLSNELLSPPPIQPFAMTSWRQSVQSSPWVVLRWSSWSWSSSSWRSTSCSATETCGDSSGWSCWARCWPGTCASSSSSSCRWMSARYETPAAL